MCSIQEVDVEHKSCVGYDALFLEVKASDRTGNKGKNGMDSATRAQLS